MNMYVDTKQIVWDEFGGLEAPQPEWSEQFAYWEDYVRKFFRSNGMDFADGDSNVEPWLMSQDRAPFAEMVRALLPRLAEQGDLSATDAILFAHWLPDLHLGTSVTNFAMHQLGLTDCFGFAISDRGLSAPFFAFDALYKYLSNGRKRGLLMIADQKHVMYKSDLVAALDPKNAACVVVLDTTRDAGLRYAGYARHTRPAGETPAVSIATVLAQLGLDAGQTRLIGPAELLQPDVACADHILCDTRLICSAPFAAFAQSDAPHLNHLLLCRDGDCITALGFEGIRA